MTWTLKHIKDRCDEVGNCWLWRQTVNSTGYPMMRMGGQTHPVPRWVVEQTIGRAIKPNHCASPACGNRRCCSPTCLREVSRSSLVSESFRAGKRNKPSEVESRRANAIRTGMAILSMDKAREIRARCQEPLSALAGEYGVTVSTIKKIRANKSWRETGANVFNWRPA